MEGQLISKENLNILNSAGLENILKNSYYPRIVLIGDSEYDSKDLSEFINLSEYVIRTDYGKGLITKKLGYKTDILYMARDNFTPFDNEKMSTDFNNFLYRKAFDDSREIWMPIHSYLINEVFLENHHNDDGLVINGDLLKKSWEHKDSREILTYHIKLLYGFYKSNIKMLDFSEYDSLCNESDLNEISLTPSPLMYCLYMSLLDSRFKTYDIYIANSSLSYIGEVKFLESLVKSGKVKVL